MEEDEHVSGTCVYYGRRPYRHRKIRRLSQKRPRPTVWASLVIREALNRSGVSDDLVDEVILGEVRQSTEASNIARCALLEAGLPESVPGYTVNRLCASSMQAAFSGCQRSGAARRM